MNVSRLRFFIRWVFPPLVSSISFVGVFLYNAIKKAAFEKIAFSEFSMALFITFVGGVAFGVAYSIYRPFLRTLGRVVGDLITGLIMMDFFFLAVYNLIQYNEFNQGLEDGLWMLLAFSTVLGAFSGWYMNITKIENGLIQFVYNILSEKE